MIRFILRKWQRNKNRKQESDPSEPEAISETNGATLILTDMNDDCLEHIFLYLSLEDLLNVVDTNKQLKSAAESAFIGNFRRGKSLVLKEHCTAICINEIEQVKLSNYQTCRLLRCFGHLIFKQNISWWHANPSRYMFKYLNQYCDKSTSEITFTSLRKICRMKRPFYNAETVRFIERCTLGSKFNRLNKLFPNVRNLVLDRCFVKSKHVEAHFPHLNQLTIKEIHMDSRCSPYIKMLRLNPQIRHLTLNTRNDKQFLQIAGEHLQFLEHIHIFSLGFNHKCFGDKIVNFAHLKELKISGCNMLTKIPISSNCLKELLIQFWEPKFHNINTFLFNFLKKHPTIRKISLTNKPNYMRNTNKETLTTIIEALSSMEEIDISVLKMSVNDAIQFLNNCKFLKKLRYKVDTNIEFDRLKTKLGAKWQATSVKFNDVRYGSVKEMYDITIICSNSKGHDSLIL